ncbi:MAG TPA: penicillin acylase family protein [Woeseiaceae bacterium]|nr:penicillin acylase family protein [Woeseiaceae bacterium]
MTVIYRIERYLLLAALFILAACGPTGTQSTDGELQRLTQRAEKVTIIRDDFGVPHIYGKSDADAVFGLMYAQAEDDFPRVERNYVWAIGRLAEVEGESAIFSDLRARLYMSEEEAKVAFESAPDWLKELCNAYADGLNYYLASHPDVKPALLTHFEPWMPMYFFEGSIGGDIEQIPLPGIEAFYGKGQGIETVAAVAPLWHEPAGSNGIAISGRHTRSGNAMLLINPHTSFYFRPEVHVVSEEGLNAYGAVTWGQFFVYQGFNEHTGWMHTSTYVDFMDEFVEETSTRDGKLMYRYGDEWRPVNVDEVNLKYRDGDSVKERHFPVYRTHHGPVTHMQDEKWVVTRINWDPVNALRQSFIRTKQHSYDDFLQMMEIRTNSSNNTVYADSGGNIAYFHGNFIPRRDTRFDYSKPVDGSNPATDWNGLHTVSESITLLNPNNGWIQNCNSTPFTAAGAFSPVPENYPVYMAPDDENFRAVHAVGVLTGIADVTLDSLIETAYDAYLPGFEKLIPGLITAFDQSSAQHAELQPAIEILRNWDLRTAADSVAMTLAHFYATRYVEESGNAAGLSEMELVNYLGTDSPPKERLQVFAATIKQLESDFGTWSLPWGEVNRFQRLSGAIDATHDDNAPSLPVGMASGNWGALAAFGAKTYPGTKKIYGYRGNSFVAVVEFGEKVRAKSLLAGGQSGHPASIHFDDQAERYVDHQFKDVAFYRDDVEARATSRYHPGERQEGLVRVALETTAGTIEVEVDQDRAPASAGSFLNYVDSGMYEGAAFYRSVRPDNDRGAPVISVVQGGVMADEPEVPGVVHESTKLTGIRHTDGVISLARGEPGTGSGAAFFICVGDQPGLDFGALRNPDGLGFAAFGHVVRGMDVVREIHTREAHGASDSEYTDGQILTEPVTITSARRLAPD